MEEDYEGTPSGISAMGRYRSTQEQLIDTPNVLTCCSFSDTVLCIDFQSVVMMFGIYVCSMFVLCIDFQSIVNMFGSDNV